MGFRSTLCSQHYAGDLPEWFKSKYEDRMLFPSHLLVVSKSEWKYYDNDFFEDYQRAVKESGFWDKSDICIVIAVLAEDDYISKVKIYENEIKYFWMEEIVETDSVWSQ